jgi:enoyl-CoA hydratase/carnithine racemase
MLINLSITDNIGIVTLNQPPYNTFTLAFFKEFQGIIDNVKGNTNIRGLILTGYGRHFSSGADIDELLIAADESVMLGHYQTFSELGQLGIPVISAIRGVCIGAAMELVLHSHFRLCTNEVVMGLPESTYNLMPGLGGLRKMAELVNKQKAMQFALCGTTFSAADALESGLADAIVSKKDLIPVAIQFAKSLPFCPDSINRKAFILKYLTPLIVDATR